MQPQQRSQHRPDVSAELPSGVKQGGELNEKITFRRSHNSPGESLTRCKARVESNKAVVCYDPQDMTGYIAACRKLYSKAHVSVQGWSFLMPLFSRDIVSACSHAVAHHIHMLFSSNLWSVHCIWYSHPADLDESILALFLLLRA